MGKRRMAKRQMAKQRIGIAKLSGRLVPASL